MIGNTSDEARIESVVWAAASGALVSGPPPAGTWVHPGFPFWGPSRQPTRATTATRSLRSLVALVVVFQAVCGAIPTFRECSLGIGQKSGARWAVARREEGTYRRHEPDQREGDEDGLVDVIRARREV